MAGPPNLKLRRGDRGGPSWNARDGVERRTLCRTSVHAACQKLGRGKAVWTLYETVQAARNSSVQPATTLPPDLLRRSTAHSLLQLVGEQRSVRGKQGQSGIFLASLK